MKNYKQKEYYRVLDNAPLLRKEKESMIGGVYEVNIKCYEDSTITLWTDKEHSDWYGFYFSDLQKCYDLECQKDGHVIGEGDVIIQTGSRYVVYDACYGDNKEWELRTRLEDDENYTFIIDLSESFTIEPLYKKDIETIEIGGIKYSKREVEEALKGIKAIK